MAARVVDHTWIGGSDAATPDVWEWTSGEPWAYESWEDGEPNDSGDCLHIWVAATGAWDDAPCTSPRAYLCERPGP